MPNIQTHNMSAFQTYDQLLIRVFQTSVQRSPRDAQHPCRGKLVAPRGTQGGLDGAVLQIRHLFGQRAQGV